MFFGGKTLKYFEKGATIGQKNIILIAFVLASSDIGKVFQNCILYRHLDSSGLKFSLFKLE